MQGSAKNEPRLYRLQLQDMNNFDVNVSRLLIQLLILNISETMDCISIYIIELYKVAVRCVATPL